MKIRVSVKCPNSSVTSTKKTGVLIASEYVDVRDLLVRMHSEDRRTRDRARKILLNFIYQIEHG